MSYASNLLRLVMVILAGHYYGSDALYWTHQNLGLDIVYNLDVYFLDYI